jgi:hypothetical protein
MVLAPGIVVPMFIFFNLLLAWGAFQSTKGRAATPMQEGRNTPLKIVE